MFLVLVYDILYTIAIAITIIIKGNRIEYN